MGSIVVIVDVGLKFAPYPHKIVEHRQKLMFMVPYIEINYCCDGIRHQ